MKETRKRRRGEADRGDEKVAQGVRYWKNKRKEIKGGRRKCIQRGDRLWATKGSRKERLGLGKETNRIGLKRKERRRRRRRRNLYTYWKYRRR